MNLSGLSEDEKRSIGSALPNESMLMRTTDTAIAVRQRLLNSSKQTWVLSYWTPGFFSGGRSLSPLRNSRRPLASTRLRPTPLLDASFA
jgi:hypothetical protein